MAYRVQYTFIKSTADSSFYYPTSDNSPEIINFRRHWLNNYKSTGKILNVEDNIINNGSTLIRTFIWKDKDSYDQATQDPIVCYNWTRRDNYHNLQNISTEMVLLD